LLDDGVRDPVPWSTRESLHKAFVEHRPLTAGSNTYSLVARPNNDVREELCRLATTDSRRKTAAYSLIGSIEKWRRRHGRPLGEPRNPLWSTHSPWPIPAPS
jgi:hypothetical protein